MSELLPQSQIANRKSQIPMPRIAIAIRPGTMDDLPFMDELQKKTTRQVGWMPTKQFEGKISAGHVLVAVAATPASPIGASVGDQGMGDAGVAATRVGYLIGNDQYFKRDDVGIIYQINVAPEYRRSFVAASLLKAQFERSAYGCKLYCCWCAQDIEANRFWESMGFVPLAYRVGSMTRGKSEGRRMKDEKADDASLSSFSLPTSSFAPKARVHIFWQKRIRANDTTTPWWFPSKTDGGAIRADRIVLPIPPGTRWDDEMPVLLPASEERREPALSAAEGLREESGERKAERRSAHRKSPVRQAHDGQIDHRKSPPRRSLSAGAIYFEAPAAPKQKTPAKRVVKPRTKTDPKLVSAARELRDRWLERVNENPSALASHGKYDVSRAIDHASRPTPLLAA